MDVANDELEEAGTIGRGVTEGERVMLVGVFGHHLDTNPIKIYQTDPRYPANTRSRAKKDNIYLLGGDYADDLSKSTATTAQKYVFFHEAAHIWQHQKTDFKSGRDEIDDSLAVKIILAKIELESIGTGDELNKTFAQILKKFGVTRYSDYWEMQNKADEAERARLRALIDALLLNVRADIRACVEQECYDPVYKGKSGLNFVNYNWLRIKPMGDPALVKEMSEIKIPPMMGERMSAYIWRVATPAFQKQLISKEIFESYMGWSVNTNEGTGGTSSEYRYMYPLEANAPAGLSNKFFDLRLEAQARLIGEYYLVKNGIDPRNVSMNGLSNFAPRPPLKFYQDMLKGVLL